MRSRIVVAVLFAAMLALGSPAHAQRGAYVPQLLPAQPSDRDARYVALRDYCGDLQLEQPVVLQLDGYVVTLELRALPPRGICIGTPPPYAAILHLVELPQDLDFAELHVTLRRANGEVWTEEVLTLNAPSFIPPSVTGTWSDASHPAQGLIVSSAPVPVFNGLTVAWTTYDADGDPLWLVGAAPHIALDHLVEIPMYAARGGTFPGRGGGGAAEVDAWGTIELEYQGCGRMTMRWDAVDAATFPAGEMQLAQLTHNTIENCDVIGHATRRGQRVDLIVPTRSGAR